MNQSNLSEVDWSKLPAPVDDGAAAHLAGSQVPGVSLPSTLGGNVNVATLSGRTVLYIYPMTGRPGSALPDGWDSIPGARGCTPQSCSFRDHFEDLRREGIAHLFGLSTQDTDYQREAALRLQLPFPLLSDSELQLATGLRLPLMTVEGRVLLKRLTMVIDGGKITKVFYPVFPPDRNAADVLNWLKDDRQ